MTVVEHLMEIKENLAALNEKLVAYPELQKQVQDNTDDISAAKTSIRVLKWVAGGIVGIPAFVAGLMRLGLF